MQKGQIHTVGYAVGTQYAVGMQYTVGVSAKRSTHTVDLANIGGVDRYLSAIRSNPHSGVCSRYTVHSRYAVHCRC